MYHLLLAHFMRAQSFSLGAVTVEHHVPPLYAIPWYELSAWVLPALIVLGLFVFLCRRTFLSQDVPAPLLLAISMLFFVAICVSVAMIDGFHGEGAAEIPALVEPYVHTHLEYFGDVPRVNEMGVSLFILSYQHPDLFAIMSHHTQTHPPGGVLFLWAASQVFGYSLLSAALATVAFTSLAVIPVYLLARDLHGEKVARIALAFFLVTPSIVLFTATSMDGPFSVFPIMCVFLFCRALKAQRWSLYACLAGLALALAMFMSYSAVFIGLFMGVAALLTFLFRRDEFRRMWRVLAVAGLTFAGCFLLLHGQTGFNLVDAILASMNKDQAHMGTGYESLGRYLNLSVANLVAFFIGMGIPLTVVWVRQLRKTLAGARNGPPVDIFSTAFAMALFLIAFSTLYTLEVERIWMFMAPFIAIPAARWIAQRERLSDFYWVIGLLCTQIVVTEVTLYTRW